MEVILDFSRIKIYQCTIIPYNYKNQIKGIFALVINFTSQSNLYFINFIRTRV